MQFMRLGNFIRLKSKSNSSGEYINVLLNLSVSPGLILAMLTMLDSQSGGSR